MLIKNYKIIRLYGFLYIFRALYSILGLMNYISFFIKFQIQITSD
jgi:hypothetical protein